MSPNMYAKVIKRPEPDTLPPDHLPGVGEATIPDKLRKIAANCRLQGFLKTADALDAAADEWEKDREQLDAMTVCRDHWEVSYKDVRKRLEAAEKDRAWLVDYAHKGPWATINDHKEFDRIAALAGEKKCPGCGVVGVNVHLLGCPTAALAGEEKHDDWAEQGPAGPRPDWWPAALAGEE